MNQKPNSRLIDSFSGSTVGLKLLDVSAALKQLARADKKKMHLGENKSGIDDLASMMKILGRYGC